MAVLVRTTSVYRAYEHSWKTSAQWCSSRGQQLEDVSKPRVEEVGDGFVDADHKRIIACSRLP